MSSPRVKALDCWSYALAPDVTLEGDGKATVLRTAVGQVRLRLSAAEAPVLRLLAEGGGSEAALRAACRGTRSRAEAEERCSALLFRLEASGLLARGVAPGGRLLASNAPLRPPPGGPPVRLPPGPIRLPPSTSMHAEGGVLALEAPASWARVSLHDRALLPLLHDLAEGREAAELVGAMEGVPTPAVRAVLLLLRWCGLACRREDSEGDWSPHDLLFHASTRRGWGRTALGRDLGAVEPVAPGDPRGAEWSAADRVPLAPPDPARLVAADPPHARVVERRRSLREQGALPLTAGELSEFLFRTLRDTGGRRPFPSAGALYPLDAWLAVGRCRGLAGGLYRYDPKGHHLVRTAGRGRALDRLLEDAAAAAGVSTKPQVLLVLSARYGRVRERYGGLAYSLILKEVGAVFHAAQLSAAAMGLAACPLGCGDALLFAELAGLDPRVEPSVGELMLGSVEGKA